MIGKSSKSMMRCRMQEFFNKKDKGMKLHFFKKIELLGVIALSILIFSSQLMAQYNDFNPFQGYESISLEDEPTPEAIDFLFSAIEENKINKVIDSIELKKIPANTTNLEQKSLIEAAFDAFEKRNFVDPRIPIYLVIKGAEISPQLGFTMSQAVSLFKIGSVNFDKASSMNLNKFINRLTLAANATSTLKAELLYDAIFNASPFIAEPVERTSNFQTVYGIVKITTEIFGKYTTTLDAIRLLKKKVFEEFGVEDKANREEEEFTFLDDTQADEDDDFIMIEDNKKEADSDDLSTLSLDEDDEFSDWTNIENSNPEEYQWQEEPSWWQKVKSKFKA